MLIRVSAVSLCLLLAACGDPAGTGGNTDSDPDTDVVTPPEPEEEDTTVNGDLSKAVYDPAAGTLTLTMLPFDGSPTDATYNRDPSLDTDGYEAFTLFENQSARRYIALFKAGTYTEAGAVATDKKFGNEYGGTYHARTGEFVAPVQGIATYRGSYTGLETSTNPSGAGPTRIRGDAMMNVDFNDLRVEGEILNRQDIDTGTPRVSLILLQTELIDGAFGNDLGEEGEYAGVLGGPNGEEMSGVLIYKDDALETFEYGSFVLDQTCISAPGVICP